MNTPGHVAVNLALLGKKGKLELSLPAITGALVPDAPIYIFYVYQKLFVSLSEREIWADAYFRPHWQLIFDTSHSIPLVIFAALVAYRLGGSAWTMFFLSMALHSAFDFPLHGDDAHRHFFPLSDYRFESPVSYWDPRRYGLAASIAEIGVVMGTSSVIWMRKNGTLDRVAIVFVILLYAVGFAFAYYYHY